mmetsp:Transcript_3676/g.5034  ORF Transcript_3676/g.5034 Transcript_3676/m.5034 type:complete len:201 (+) Transcript_3676:553-1155(+)
MALQQALVRMPVFPGQDVSIADDGDARQTGVLRLRGLQHILPVRQFGIALSATAAVDKYGGDASLGGFLQQWHQLVSGGRLVVPARSQLHSQLPRAQVVRHRVNYIQKFIVFAEKRGSGTAVTDHVNGTAAVQIHEVRRRLVVQDPGHPAHEFGGIACQLHSEHVLTGVAAQQRPLRGLALLDVGRHGHLPTSDVRPEVL